MATLSQLVAETTTIKNNLTTCHTNLKTKLQNKGVSVVSTDKMSTLINKIDSIPSLPSYAKEIWTKGPDGLSRRYGGDAAVLGDNIYHIGGYYTSRVNYNEVYNITNNTWTTKASMPTARYYLNVEAAANMIFAIGGNGTSTSSTNECYNPSTNTWTTKASKPSVVSLGASAAIGNRIYISGGANSSSNSYYNKNECYDASTNTWSTLTSLPSPRYNSAGVAHDGKIYNMGGYNYSTQYITNYCYDPSTNTWSSKASLKHELASAKAVVLNDNKIHVIGGHRMLWGLDAWDEEYYHHQSVDFHECYNPSTNTWDSTRKLGLPTAREKFPAVAVGNKIYAMSGIIDAVETDDIITTREMEIYIQN